MATDSGRERTGSVSRIIKAPRRTIYQAFLDPEALVPWLPPAGMQGRIHAFDARSAGAYRMSLTDVRSDRSRRGKTCENTDSRARTGATASCGDP